MSKVKPISLSFRIVVLFFLFTYTIFSIGIIKATHFCKGREASVTFFSSETKKCAGELGAITTRHCCNDEHELVRIEDDQKTFTGYNLNIPHLYILEDLYTEKFIASSSGSGGADILNGVDLPPKVPIFAKNCSLVFYDHGSRS